MRKTVWLAVLLALALGGPADSMTRTTRGAASVNGLIAGKTTPPPPYTGPGDIVASATAWWGMRGYNAAYTGNAINVCLPADSACADIPIVNGNLSSSAISALGCGDPSPICTIKTFYDQSGGTNNLTNPTVGTRAKLLFSCAGSLFCATLTAGNSRMLGTSSVSIANPFTISSVTVQSLGQNADLLIATTSTYGVGFASPTSGFMSACSGNGIVTVAAAYNTVHALQTVFNGASSFFYLDGVSTSVNLGSTTLSGFLQMNNSNCTTQGSFTFYEIGIWSSAFSSGNQSSMNSNQHTYWGF